MQQSKQECTESAAGVVAKAFRNGMVGMSQWTCRGLDLLINLSRTLPADQSRKLGIYYVVGLVMKCYFRVRFYFTLAHPSSMQYETRSNVYQTFCERWNANPDITPLTAYPRSHQVLSHLGDADAPHVAKVDY